jgi:hypothetical protein
LVRFDGPLRDDRFDFTDWDWGDLDEAINPLATHIAEVIGEQFRRDWTTPEEPHLDVDSDGYHKNGDGGLCISISVGEGFLVVPLGEIVIDDEMVLVDVAKDGETMTATCNWDRSLAAKRDALDILRGWITEIERQIEADSEERQKEQAS